MSVTFTAADVTLAQERPGPPGGPLAGRPVRVWWHSWGTSSASPIAVFFCVSSAFTLIDVD